MWEDERAPQWRRQLLLFRLLAGGLAVLLVAAVVALFVTNALWAFLASVALVIGLLLAYGRAATYRGRLELPARKARERARRQAHRHV